MNKPPTWQRTIIIALVTLIIGGCLLFWAYQLPTDNGLRILLFNIGSFIIASVVMALIFQFWQLRGLIEDLFHQAGIIEQLKRAKLVGFSTVFFQNVPWSELFEHSSQIRIVFAYARSWRHTNKYYLEQFLGRKGTNLIVLLPDPDYDIIINEMAHRFDSNYDELTKSIEEAAQELETLAENRPGNVSIFYFKRSLTYTCYLFDSRAVFTSYRHNTGQGGILTLQGERGGELYAWLEEEWYGCIKSENVRPRKNT